MARRLLITLAGEAQTGKSSIAAELADLMRMYGVRYHLLDPDINQEHVPYATRSIEDVMRAMAAKDVVVTIETKQLNREVKTA